MNSHEENTNDVLKQYLRPGKVEMAPEGFTGKVLDSLPKNLYAKPTEHRAVQRNYVPIVAVAVIIFLVFLAVILPGKETSSVTVGILKIANNMSKAFSHLAVPDIFSTKLPSVLTYIFIGCIILTIVDRALSRIFHRQ